MKINNRVRRSIDTLLKETDAGNSRNFELSYWENSAKISWVERYGGILNPELLKVEIFVTLEDKDES